MEILFIRNDQNLIFKHKSLLIPGKRKEKQLQNRFTPNIIKGEIVKNRRLLNFIKLYFDLSSMSNYLTSKSDEINLEKLTSGKFSSVLNLKKVNDIRYINKFFETVNKILPNSKPRPTVIRIEEEHDLDLVLRILHHLA